MVFLAKTSTSGEWKAVSSAISTLVEEATFEASLEGITFRAMDPSHVALVDLLWPKSAFEKYECDKPFKFTVKMEDFAKLIKRADTKDNIEITTSDEMLVLRIVDGYKREFLLHLIESTYGPTPLPKLSFNVRATVAERAFERMLIDISAVSDHVTIDASKDRLVFTGKSDIGSGSVTLEKATQDVLELEVKEDSKATYNIEYLSGMIKATGSASDTVALEYSNKMPIRLELKLSDLGGRIHFYLAPRIEEK
ncbi:MAG: proliferating cell nuclear antigen (pcna) [Nitrososphaerales archaeon]|nr:proliferating cell nuclear antigen (pcna) [Nitrososphaerales archaeon]